MEKAGGLFIDLFMKILKQWEGEEEDVVHSGALILDMADYHN